MRQETLGRELHSGRFLVAGPAPNGEPSQAVRRREQCGNQEPRPSHETDCHLWTNLCITIATESYVRWGRLRQVAFAQVSGHEGRYRRVLVNRGWGFESPASSISSCLLPARHLPAVWGMPRCCSVARRRLAVAKYRAPHGASTDAYVRALAEWFMETARPAGGARRLIDRGHVLIGGAALVVALVLVVAGQAPTAELDGVLVGLGLLLALAAVGFTWTAILALRRASDGRGVVLSLILSVVELAVGAALAAAVALAVQGYGAVEPWRSPLLLPSALLLALGLAGLGVEAVAHRRATH